MTLIFQSTKNLVAISEPESDFFGVTSDPGGRWVLFLQDAFLDPGTLAIRLSPGGYEVTDPIPGSSKLFHP